MNIIVKHIIGGVIFLAVSVGAAFGAFKYGEYVGNERATEELNRFKGILSKTEETKYLNGEWWFYVDLYGYHQRSDDNYDKLTVLANAMHILFFEEYVNLQQFQFSDSIQKHYCISGEAGN